jgi:hypothetical protein
MVNRRQWLSCRVTQQEARSFRFRTFCIPQTRCHAFQRPDAPRLRTTRRSSTQTATRNDRTSKRQHAVNCATKTVWTTCLSSFTATSLISSVVQWYRRQQDVSSLACKVAVAFRMSLILCSLDAFHMRLGVEYHGTQRQWPRPSFFSRICVYFPVTCANHSSSAHRVCLSSGTDYRPKWWRPRRPHPTYPPS